MAFAISTVVQKDCGQHYDTVININASGTYTTAGDAMSFANAKIKTASKPYFGMGVASNGATAIYIPSSDKIQLWNGTTEFGSGGSLTGVTVQMAFKFQKV